MALVFDVDSQLIDFPAAYANQKCPNKANAHRSIVIVEKLLIVVVHGYGWLFDKSKHLKFEQELLAGALLVFSISIYICVLKWFEHQSIRK